MLEPDLLIIGGGITGQCAALVAADAGAMVTIVDMQRNAGSHANAGSLHVQMQSRFLRLNPHLADNLESSLPLYMSAVAEWQALDAALGGVELTQQGGLMLADTPAQLDFLHQKAAREQKKGLDVEILYRDTLHRLAPWLSPHVVGAELCRNEGKLNPLIANRKMREALTARGVRFVQDQITHITDGPRPIAHGAQNYPAGAVLIASSWGGGQLAQPLGLRIQTPPEPLHMNITEAGAYEIQHLVQHAERPITLKQFRSGQVVIGGGWQANLARDDSAAPAIKPDSLLGNVALAARIAPGIGGLRVLRTWAGYNTPVDGKTTVGAVRDGGRVFVGLPGDAGYTLGPVVGRMAANAVLSLPQAVDPEPYSPARWRA
ncbi:Glycine/D-amino acid oxidase [Monaibacterium marinum]|uniref:Glycine/D-amino acid oxidase n=1 Tax=Pontivivens marinum TaxID=1690039 RepID=A0A2C9CUJ1_9RHOB|nr:FAD-dependent oxidoreductase [Monaibacterium marinum]SOH94883.1 Glycine/D-amino acid oxidase [Monaibacterium marinum]